MRPPPSRDPARGGAPAVAAREACVAFAERFCAGDLDGLTSLLAPEFRLRGPLYRFDSREDYLRALREDPPQPAACRILEVCGSGDAAAVLYEYCREPAPILVAQFNRVTAAGITEVRLVFDTAPAGAAEGAPSLDESGDA